MKYQIIILAFMGVLIYIVGAFLLAGWNTFIDTYNQSEYLDELNHNAKQKRNLEKVENSLTEKLPLVPDSEIYKTYWNNDDFGIRIDGFDLGSEVEACRLDNKVCKRFTVVGRVNSDGEASIPKYIFTKFFDLKYGHLPLEIKLIK